MTVKIEDFVALCEDGKQPVIKMSDNIHDFADESFDPGMMGRVVDVSMEYEDSYRLLVNMNGYEKHNKSVAVHNWRDDKGELTLSWFDTEYYPENGIEPLYIPLKEKVPFEVVNQSYLFSNYLKSEYNSYVEFLEDTVEELKQQNKELRTL